jgi:hypothetical protein
VKRRTWKEGSEQRRPAEYPNGWITLLYLHGESKDKHKNQTDASWEGPLDLGERDCSLSVPIYNEIDRQEAFTDSPCPIKEQTLADTASR